MQKYPQTFYIDAIRSVYPQAKNIRQPDVIGRVGTVLLAETDEGTTVCKFNDMNIIQHNYKISQLLRQLDVSVPKIKTHMFCDAFFETYKYCPDKTLHEFIQQGISKKQIFDIYKQTMYAQKEISEIPHKKLDLGWGKYAYEIFTYNKMQIAPKITTKIKGCLYRMFSTKGQQVLSHNDIQPKNLLVNNDMQLTALIDLDSVALCNENFSVLQTLYAYPSDNYVEYIECYQDITKHKLNQRAILTGLGILQQLRKCKHAIQR